MSVTQGTATPIDPWACEHPSRAPRWRTRANGMGVWVEQCLVCGKELRGLKKDSPSVQSMADRVPFDEALFNLRKTEHLQSYQERWRAQASEAAEREQRQKAAEKQAWWRWYNDYLKTDAWRAKRALVLKRAGGVCEGCQERRATQVHHLTYDHVGNELLFELVAICDSCHRIVHPDMDEAW